MRLFIRRQICLTLLKKRKRNINNKCDSYIEKSFYSNNNYIDENKNKFTNISLENNVNNFFIKSINKEKKYDFSVSHFKIICNKNHIRKWDNFLFRYECMTGLIQTHILF